MYSLVFKRCLFFALFCLVALSSQAQNLKISGSILEPSKESIPFAPVALMRASEASPILVKAVTTDDNGKFSFDGLTAGSYFVSISYLGFKDFKSQIIQISTQNIDLEPFILEKNANELKEVELVVQKPIVEVLADKTVFNVQSTLNATGTNGFELLRKAPGVVVDNSDNLIVEGKNGVQVFIDGKLSVLTGQDLVNYLKTIQSADIEAIEIITQPSSKFDAAGTAGIINIKFKKNKNFGTNGSVGLGYAYGRYGKVNSSLSLNHRNRHINTYLNYSNRMGNNWNFMNLNRTQEGVLYAQSSENVNFDKNQNVKAGLDFFATKKSTFGVLFSANLGDVEARMNARTPISLTSNNALQQVLIAQSNTDMRFSNLTGNLNYRFADTLGHSFNVDLDVARYNNVRKNEQPNSLYNANETQLLATTNYAMDTPININIASIKADYEQKLAGGKLGLGVKSSLVSTDNSFQFFNVADGKRFLDKGRSNDFFYKENINAAYANYNYKWKKVNIQVGLRVENTISEGKLINEQQNNDSLVNRNYTNLFPSAGLTYNLNKNNVFALTYSKRIERPNYQILNPFRRQMDTLSFRAGNAYLRPQYVDNVKISHTYKYSLTTAISYSFIQDFFAQITEALPNGRSSIMEQNVATQEVLNLSVTYPFNITKWWNVYASLNLTYNNFKGKNDNFVALSQTTFNFYGQNTFSLPKGWKFEVSGWFNSPSIWGGTYLTNSLGSLDLALQKNLMHDRLNMRLAFSDIFFTSPWYGKMQFGDLRINGNGGWESRQVRLNLTYSFGGKEIKGSRRRNTGIDEENNRLGGN
jgi:outer membrane receptor protein involved in Fe transport